MPRNWAGSVSKTEAAIGPIAGKLFLNLLVKTDKILYTWKLRVKHTDFRDLVSSFPKTPIKPNFQQQKNYGQY